MAFDTNATTPDSLPSQGCAVDSKYSYSRRRWNAFEAWQEHVRKSAATVGSAFTSRTDRDLRRVVIVG